MSVTPRFLPFQPAGVVMPEVLAHISRSPGAPDSWTTSTTSLPLAWKSMVCTYQAPAELVGQVDLLVDAADHQGDGRQAGRGGGVRRGGARAGGAARAAV